MFTRFTRCSKIDHHIALSIEAAGISHVGVIVRRSINIVVLGPAHTFQMNGYGSSRRPGNRSHAGDAGLNGEVCPRNRLFAVAEFEGMLPAEILWNRHRKFDSTATCDVYFSNGGFLWRESVATDAAAHIGLPIEVHRRVGRKTGATQHGVSARRTLLRVESQLRICNVYFSFGQGIGLVRLSIRSR